MKREKVETLDEREIITGLITSDKFCREVVPSLKPRCFQLSYAQTISHWIIGYYKDYKKAPGRDIRQLYISNKNTIRDEDLQESILDFIARLSKDYERQKLTNEPFAIKRAIEYLERRSLQLLIDDVTLNLNIGDTKKARSLITDAKTIASHNTGEVDILTDTDVIIDAFLKEDDVMFQFPGAFGKVAGVFRREDFISFVSPMKRGKSWFLMYTALCAMYAGYKVLFFTLEMSEHQMIRRIWQNIYGQSPEAVRTKVPFFEETETEDGTSCIIKYKAVQRKAFNSTALKKKQKAQKQVVRSGGLKLVSLPAYNKNVIDIEAMVDNYAQGITKDGRPFIADVIVIDYADILAPCGSRGEYRHNLDETWKRLRGMAQLKKCLVVTASQSDRSSIKTGKVGAGNISEDIRKLAHVTSMMALNQTEDEAQKGIMKIKQLAIREGKKEYRGAIVLQSLALGKPYIDSRFEGEVVIEDNENKYKPKKINRNARPN